MKPRAPSTKAQRAMLVRLREHGLLLAGPDNPVLRHLERRRWAHAMLLHDSRTGKPTMSRAWQITAAGTAASFGIEKAPRRAASRWIDRQIDIEDAIAACPSSSGGRPDATPLTDPDAPAPVRADVSAPVGRPVETCARGPSPETAHA